MLREIALEIRCVDNDVREMTGCSSDGVMKREMMPITGARTA
jgi:hypothetical protein